MITEDYVSYEVAKLLKEKGFNEPITELNKLLFNEGEKPVLRITHQKAIKWLREMYKIYIDIETCYTYINKNENFEVTGYEFTIHSQYESCYEDHETYNSYEEAVEAALKYSLENLI